MPCCEGQLGLGPLRTPLRWLRPPSQRDAYGQSTGSYTATGKTIWCDLRALSLREIDGSRQTYASATHRARGRWMEGVNVRDRMQHGRTGQVYEVVGVDNENDMSRVLVLTLASQPDDPNA